VREGRAFCVVIFWSGNLCGVQMSLTLVFSDDLSHSSTFIHIERGRGGLVTVDPCGQAGYTAGPAEDGCVGSVGMIGAHILRGGPPKGTYDRAYSGSGDGSPFLPRTLLPVFARPDLC
jgi:hypothetical protein